MRIGAPGAEKPVARIDEETYVDLSDVVTDFDEEFFGSDGLNRVRPIVTERTTAGRVSRFAGERVGAPVARPHQILCIGLNYRDHAAESGMPVPDEPILFTKSPNTLIGPHDDVRIPRGSAKTDWEVELAVVIGRQARYVETDEEALASIAGYAVSNDVSERTFQIEQSGGQWSKGKCCETFNPFGPALVPADEVDPTNLNLKSWVNGEPRQNSNTRDMIFGVAALIRDLSQYMVLSPGDIVNTGTPEGVALSGRFPYLSPGDTMEMEIDGLGRQRQALGKA